MVWVPDSPIGLMKRLLVGILIMDILSIKTFKKVLLDFIQNNSKFMFDIKYIQDNKESSFEIEYDRCKNSWY